jgi:hypothetical protein
MKCTKCGAENADNAYKCVQCGEVLQQPATPGAVAQKIPNYLVQSILVTLFCCLPLGIVAIIFAAQVNGKVQAGDIPGAMESSRKAKMFCWISLGIGLVLIVVWLVMAALGMAAGFAHH